jgi:transcription elongation factor Elf1
MTQKVEPNKYQTNIKKHNKMIHRICDTCGKTESVDFMVAIDDNIYCTECDEANQKTKVKILKPKSVYALRSFEEYDEGGVWVKIFKVYNDNNIRIAEFENGQIARESAHDYKTARIMWENWIKNDNMQRNDSYVDENGNITNVDGNGNITINGKSSSVYEVAKKLNRMFKE